MYSMYFTMFGWSNFFSKFTSLSIERIFSADIDIRSILFIATVLAVSESKALYTSPIAPFPISSPSCCFYIFLKKIVFFC